MNTQEIQIESGRAHLSGDISLPRDPHGVVIFAHGSGSSRFSRRNRFVASRFYRGGLATLLMDLLTPEEEQVDLETREHRFDIDLLAERLRDAHLWALANLRHEVAYIGSSTGAAAALLAAARSKHPVAAVVSRGGRPDLAGAELADVQAPTRLIVGSLDTQVLELNRRAQARLKCRNDLVIVPGATHLFEEPGTLEWAAEVANDWLQLHLAPAHRPVG